MLQTKIRRYLTHGFSSQLAVFEAIARLGSFTRAGEEVHLAQPTVSVQIRKLTDLVGLPLFEQVGKRIYLTDAGRRLYCASQEIFRVLSEAEDNFVDMRGLKSARLDLAVSTTGTYFAPRMLAAFIKQYPGIEVSLQVHNHQTLIGRLTANQDDLYIFAHPPQEPDVATQAILPNPMVVFARTDHPLAGETNIPFDRLAEEPFLMREPGSGTRMVAERLFDQHRRKPWTRMELCTNEAIKQAIFAGLGVSILPRHTFGFDTEQAQLTTLDVMGFPLECHWHFVYPAGKRLTPVAKTFMDFVLIEARQLNHLASRSLNGYRSLRSLHKSME